MIGEIHNNSAYDVSILSNNVTSVKAAKSSDTIKTTVDRTEQIELSESRPGTSPKVEEASLKSNAIFQIPQTSLHFSVDSSTGSLVVQVINQETGELLRQIPQESVNRFADSFGKMVGMIINEEA